MAGFEPTTTTPPVWCATRLRYIPKKYNFRTYYHLIKLTKNPLVKKLEVKYVQNYRKRYNSHQEFNNRAHLFIYREHKNRK